MTSIQITPYRQPLLFLYYVSISLFNHSYEKVVGDSFFRALRCYSCAEQSRSWHSQTWWRLLPGFPGLRSYCLTGEYAYSLSDNLQGGFGIKRLNMSGCPRTPTLNEFTKATTLDFNIYFLPLANEFNIFRIGLGYSFSFYNTRRSYPVLKAEGSENEVTWPIQDAKGRTSGVIFTGEYEYLFSTKVSLGIKASFCKASDRVFYVGHFLQYAYKSSMMLLTIPGPS